MFHMPSHPENGRRDDIVATFFCPSQRHHKYVSNETPNNASVERRKDVLVVRRQDVIKERCDNVSRVLNNSVSLVRLHDVSN